MIIQTSGTVVVILDHTADRNVDSQFFQYGQGNIHLSTAAVHEDQIRGIIFRHLHGFAAVQGMQYVEVPTQQGRD